MRELVAIAYKDETLAGRAAEEIERCAAGLGIDPDAVAVAVCGRDGRVLLTTSHCDGAITRWSEFWGSLLDAVLTAGPDFDAVGGGFPARLRRALAPGTSALLIAILAERRGAVLSVLSPFDGERLSCPLSGDLARP